MTTINDFLSWCSQFWQKLSEQWWPTLENQYGLLLRTLTASVTLTTLLSFAALICSSLVLRSMTMGGWRWARGLLMILLFLAGMLGVIFVVREI
jgi:hypothetical protein